MRSSTRGRRSLRFGASLPQTALPSLLCASPQLYSKFCGELRAAFINNTTGPNTEVTRTCASHPPPWRPTQFMRPTPRRRALASMKSKTRKRAQPRFVSPPNSSIHNDGDQPLLLLPPPPRAITHPLTPSPSPPSPRPRPTPPPKNAPSSATKTSPSCHSPPSSTSSATWTAPTSATRASSTRRRTTTCRPRSARPSTSSTSR